MKKETNDYSKVFTELDEIFYYMPEELLKKVPARIKKEVKENKNKDYVFHYDITKELIEQDIYEQTKDFISLIYILYICKKEEKQILLKKCRENDEKEERAKEKLYDIEKIFNDKIDERLKKEESSSKEETANETKKDLIERKQTFFSKIIDKIKKFLKNLKKS